MRELHKSRSEILKKLGIDALNPMQIEAIETIRERDEVVVLSDTGTGKTLAFLLPLLDGLDADITAVQILVLVPSRELAIQIEQVIREMGTGHKTNAVYGGRMGSKDRMELKHAPAILVGTPGRVADHLRRRVFDTAHVQALVLDEFDKLLEVGFEDEMKEIISLLPAVKKKILTSATSMHEFPSFVGLDNQVTVNYLDNSSQGLRVKVVVSESKEKLATLAELLSSLAHQRGIVFCNFKDSIRWVSEYLEDRRIDHVCFYGGLEQIERERALIKFRNGTHRVLIATDLAARGIDVPALDFIIHHQLPPRVEEFTHRNGRTARMNAEGTAYVLRWQEQELPDFVTTDEEHTIIPYEGNHPPRWATLYISGGRKDKISKGDVAGLFFKQGQLSKEELGVIELKQECSFVAVPKQKARRIADKLNNTRLKKKKVRISLVE